MNHQLNGRHSARRGTTALRLALIATITAIASATAQATNPAYHFALQLGSASGSNITDDDYGNAIAVDSQGNLYVTGVFNNTVDFDPGTGTANLTAIDTGDAFVAKYDASGNYVWAFRVGGIMGSYGTWGSSANEGKAIAIDANGNVVVAGVFSGTADFDPGSGTANLTSTGTYGGRDMFVAKYSSAGAYQWAFAILNANNPSMALDGNGSVLVTSNFAGTTDVDPGSGTLNLKASTSMSMFVAKYSSAGAYQWAFKLVGERSVSTGPIVRSIASDGSGNVYVAGKFDGKVNFNPGGKGTMTANAGDAFVAKYTPSGSYSWAIQLGGTSSDYATAVAVDGSGNVFVAGSFQGTADFSPGNGTANRTSAGAEDIFLAKYTSAGAYSWAHGFGTTGSEGASSIAIDGSGDVLLCGSFRDTVDFDPGSGTANLIAVAASTVIARYTASGAYAWAFVLGSTSSTDGATSGRSILSDGAGGVFVTGMLQGTVDFDPSTSTASRTSAGRKDIFIGAYSESAQPKRVTAQGGTEATAVSAAPNPYFGSFRLRLADPDTPAFVEIFDVFGRAVTSLDASTADVTLGEHLPAGTYLVVVTQAQSRHGILVEKAH